VRHMRQERRHADVVLVRGLGAVVHQRSEARPQAAHVLVIVRAVIEVQHDRDVCLLGGGAHHGGGKLEPGVADSALAHLQDDRGLFLDGGVNDPLDLLHVVGVECADGPVAFIGGAQNLLAGNEWHRSSSE